MATKPRANQIQFQIPSSATATTLPRTLQSKSNEVVSVLDFGAVPGGR